eukprot:TRINITY_DN871_c0_g3_i1.p1 TRINITY_DN871_c0_g3~~TRINITY_DN871_c0_g3_i1.p1  ORF type:complete len:435 (-),score=139.84 TRINITY_DN871_c0_g3_i1:138-1442(-)
MNNRHSFLQNSSNTTTSIKRKIFIIVFFLMVVFSVYYFLIVSPLKRELYSTQDALVITEQNRQNTEKERLELLEQSHELSRQIQILEMDINVLEKNLKTGENYLNSKVDYYSKLKSNKGLEIEELEKFNQDQREEIYILEKRLEEKEIQHNKMLLDVEECWDSFEEVSLNLNHCKDELFAAEYNLESVEGEVEDIQRQMSELTKANHECLYVNNEMNQNLEDCLENFESIQMKFETIKDKSKDKYYFYIDEQDDEDTFEQLTIQPYTRNYDLYRTDDEIDYYDDDDNEKKQQNEAEEEENEIINEQQKQTGYKNDYFDNVDDDIDGDDDESTWNFAIDAADEGFGNSFKELSDFYKLAKIGNTNEKEIEYASHNIQIDPEVLRLQKENEYYKNKIKLLMTGGSENDGPSYREKYDYNDNEKLERDYSLDLNFKY